MERYIADGTPWGNTEETTLQQLEESHWGWLLSEGNFELLLNVHRQLEDLPETSQTWTYSVLDGVSYHDITDALIVLLDSWPAPDWVQSHQTGRRYVNPGYTDRARLSEPATICECGALIGKSNQFYHDDWNSEHNDDCRIEDKKFTDGEVWSKRRTAMYESIVYLRKEPYMADRLGMTKSTMSYVAKQLEFPRWEMRQESREAAKLVAERLVDEHQRKDVAVAFSVDPSTISKWVNGPYV